MSDGIQLVVEVDDRGEAKIRKLNSALGGLGDNTGKTSTKWKDAFERMNRAAEGVANRVQRIATSVPAMMAGLGLGIGVEEIVRGGIRANATLEKMRLNFEQLGYSAAAARAMVSRVEDIEIHSLNTELEDLGQAARTFVASGMDMNHWLDLLADVAGSTTMSVNDLAKALVRVKEGSPTRALMLLTTQGLVTKKMLADVGIRFDEETMKLESSAADALEGIEKVLVARFGGLQSKLHKGWAGLADEAKKWWDEIGEQVTAPLTRRLEPALRSVKEWLEKVAKSDDLEKTANRIADAIEDMGRKTVEATRFLREHWGTISSTATILATYAIAIGVVTTALRTATAAHAAFNWVMKQNIYVRIATLVLALIPLYNAGAKALGGWQHIFDVVGAAAQTAGGFMKWFGQGAIATWSGVVGFVRAAIGSLLTAALELGTALVKAITLQPNDAKKAVERFQKAGADGWAAMAESMGDISGAWDEGWASFAADTKARFAQLGAEAGAEFKKGAGEEPWVFGTGPQPEAPLTPSLAATIEKQAAEKARREKLFRDMMNAPLPEPTHGTDYGRRQIISGTLAATKGGGMMQRQIDRLEPTSRDKDLEEQLAAQRELYGSMEQAAEEFRTHYEELWGGMWGSIADVTQQGLGDMMAAVFDTSKDFGEAITEIWQNMERQFIQSVANMAAGWVVNQLKMLVAKKTFEAGATAAAVAGSAARTAAAAPEIAVTTTQTAADTAGAAAKIAKAHAWIPFVGVAIAAGLIGAMIAVLATAGKKRRAGGRISGLDLDSGAGDTVPVDASQGEYFVRKSAVDKYGVGFMDAVNDGTFQSGGAGLSVTLNVDARGNSSGAAIGAEIEARLVPVLERLARQRRLKLA